MAGSRHTPTYYSHMYKACTWTRTTHATVLSVNSHNDVRSKGGWPHFAFEETEV